MGSSKLNRRTFLQTSVGTIATTAAAAEAFRAWAADAPATVVPGPKLDARP
ncbi:hypothetical protein FJY63_09310, partial [Candidatus Sumerlaeota bacterium]|nr:hypothetical protein [Candidatus Sumerlaeota bacterium]